MIGLLNKPVQLLIVLVVASFAPLIASRHAEQRWQRGFVIAIHVVAVLSLLGLLMAAQFYWQLESFVRSTLPMVRVLWLPLIGSLLYATAWSTWFVARTLRRPDEQPLFDTVTLCLQSGLERFSRAGIDITRTPLFLVLGSPAGGIREFFSAARTDLSVLPQPEEADEPVQVCGNQDAIYVCCRDVSLLGRFTRQAAEDRVRQRQISLSEKIRSSLEPAHVWSGKQRWEVGSGRVSAVEPSGGLQGGASPAVTATATLEPRVVEAAGNQATVQRLQDTIDQLETLTVDESASEPSKVLQPREAVTPWLRLDAGEAERLLTRLEGLCREISEYREPYCPINGVLLLVPLDATDSVETADHVGMRMERDLLAIATATESAISAQLIFCDLEQCVGSQAFLDRFPDSQRHRRLGACLPAPPPSEPDSGAQGIDRAVQWICNELFPPLGYRLMRRDLSDSAVDRTLRVENRQIHQLIDSMRRRREGMSRMLRRAIVAASGHVRLRGCFIAATGATSQSRQAFAEGVLPLILDIQNEVQWTSARRRRDRWQRTAAIATYATVSIAATVTLVWSLGSF